MKKIVSTSDAPKAIGPYSQAVVSSGFAFLSGQIPLDAASGQMVEGDIAVHYEHLRALAGEHEAGRHAVAQPAGRGAATADDGHLVLQSIAHLLQSPMFFSHPCS